MSTDMESAIVKLKQSVDGELILAKLKMEMGEMCGVSSKNKMSREKGQTMVEKSVRVKGTGKGDSEPEINSIANSSSHPARD